jgi:phosphatidylglycerol:prolipoprotein diacylglycerol transferase
LTTVEKAAGRLDLHVPWTYSLATVGLVTGFVAARVIFVAGHWTAYRENLLGVVWPLTSGFNILGGLLVGAFAAFFYGRGRRLPAGATLDAIAPGVLVASIAVSLADFLAGPGYGVEADLPWSISLFGIERHPVQIYEIIVAATALLVWIWLHKKPAFDGQLFLISAAIFFAGRLLVDAFRANALLTSGGYHLVQILSLVALLATLLVLMNKQTRTGIEAQR